MKKLGKPLMALGMLLAIGGHQATAAAPPSGDSDVSIGFYGYWTPPETESGPIITDEETNREIHAPDRPEIDGNNLPPGARPETGTESRPRPGNLPATGGAAMLNLRFIGIGLLILALLFWAWKKKKSKTLMVALTALWAFGEPNAVSATLAVQQSAHGTVVFYSSGLTLDRVDPIAFGSAQIVNVDMVYYALAARDEDGNPRAHYVQLSDFRGTGQGWSLHVRKNGPLANELLAHPILEGAEIHILNSEAVSASGALAPSTFDIVLDATGALQRAKVAATDEGMMTWLKVKNDVALIDGTYRNRNIQFHIPGTTPRSAGNYYTDITWILSDVPL